MGRSATNCYYFNRNLLGDVIGIYDTSGALVAKYIYDAWGNCTIAGETTNNALAHANPIRYRGYYYDDDTGLYYLNTRYYSPKWRRFISPDSTEYLDPETVNGLNLYCYCGNDPINRIDRTGHKWYQAVWSWICNATDAITDFCTNLFGLGTVLENTYDMFEIRTFLGNIETGISTARRIAGDISKPISVFWQKASRWWKFWQNKLGIQLNIGNGGVSLSFGIGEISGSFSFGTGWTFELFAGIEKIGFTFTKYTDFGTHEGGDYYHMYIRTIPAALMLLAAAHGIIPQYVPAFG